MKHSQCVLLLAVAPEGRLWSPTMYFCSIAHRHVGQRKLQTSLVQHINAVKLRRSWDSLLNAIRISISVATWAHTFALQLL